MNALGYAGGVLDKPGRAVRGLLSGRLDEGLAALPFSDSLGVTDPGRRTSGTDLLRALGAGPEGVGGDLAGFGAELATDPLLYAGAGLGRVLGKNAEAAAVARGPRYGTTAEDLKGMVLDGPLGGDVFARRRMDELLKQPNAARVLSEIPEGSSVLGAGAEGMAFKTPAGDTLRIGRVLPESGGRPAAEGVLQNTRAVDIPGTGRPYRAERAPLAERVGDDAYWRGEEGAAKLGELEGTLGKQGLLFDDRHAGNVGLVGGRPTVIDPGALTNLGNDAVRTTVPTAFEPSRPMNALLDALGGDRAVRSALDAGLAGPEFARRLTGYGGFLGADLGAYGRTQATRR